MSELWANDAGTARHITDIWVNDAGTARQIREIWVNDNGVARQLFALVGVHDFTVSDTRFTPTDCFCGFSMQGSLSGAPGYVASQTGTAAPPGTVSPLVPWVQPGSSAANYEIRVTQLSGTVNVASGASLNTWIRMNIITSGSFYAQRTSNIAGTTTATALLEIRRFSDSVVVSSCTVTMSATVE